MSDAPKPDEDVLHCGPIYLVAGLQVEVAADQPPTIVLALDVDPGRVFFGLDRHALESLQQQIELVLQQRPEDSKPS